MEQRSDAHDVHDAGVPIHGSPTGGVDLYLSFRIEGEEQIPQMFDPACSLDLVLEEEQ